MATILLGLPSDVAASSRRQLIKGEAVPAERRQVRGAVLRSITLFFLTQNFPSDFDKELTVKFSEHSTFMHM